jgi:predicted ribosomally synthesized peptide with SipW-like signal peptide
MGRQTLRIVMVLGVLVTLVGGTGIFAAFTDRATTGTNTVTSGARPHAADIRISPALVEGVQVNCDADANMVFDDDLTTGLFELNGFQPGIVSNPAYLCIRNEGSASVDVAAAVIDLVDTDVDCTGDEAEVGDLTCGESQAGELSFVVAIQIEQVACATNASNPLQSNSLASWVANPVTIPGSLAPNEVRCIRFVPLYPSTTVEADIQLAQSDQVQWRFAFDASVAE